MGKEKNWPIEKLTSNFLAPLEANKKKGGGEGATEMGIATLLPLLKGITKTVHIGEYAHQRVAVDAYCWLHRGAYSCSTELCQNIPTTK